MKCWAPAIPTQPNYQDTDHQFLTKQTSLTGHESTVGLQHVLLTPHPARGLSKGEEVELHPLLTTHPKGPKPWDEMAARPGWREQSLYQGPGCKWVRALLSLNHSLSQNHLTHEILIGEGEENRARHGQPILHTSPRWVDIHSLLTNNVIGLHSTIMPQVLVYSQVLIRILYGMKCISLNYGSNMRSFH